ncbi:MAG: TIGR00730 family Rossman fold protein [Thiotrichales bacterium]|nr:TIGR00730 family Rossman fold protein [Thiotrichales bacterium]
MSRLCVFCGSNPGRLSSYTVGARAMGHALVDAGCGLVYGGGSGGMMGAVADGVLEKGGEAIGIVPEGLFADEHVHTGLTQKVMTRDFAERKAKMAELSDGFIALPGGLGTLDELFEMWVSVQLGIEDLPVGLLNTDGFYDRLLDFLDHCVTENYVSQANRDMLICETDPKVLVQRVLTR